MIVESSNSDYENSIVDSSGIKGAGNGLFALSKMMYNEVVGYFGGELVCAQCVRSRKLSQGKGKFTTVECGLTTNDSGVQVLWYLHRTGVVATDGPMWYINSSKKNNPLRVHKKPNCYIQGEGFDGEGKPLSAVRIYTEFVDVEGEFLLDYYQ